MAISVAPSRLQRGAFAPSTTARRRATPRKHGPPRVIGHHDGIVHEHTHGG